VLPAGFLAIPLALDQKAHLFEHGGAVGWPLVCVAVYAVLARLEECHAEWTRASYAPALWLVALVAALGSGGFAESGLDLEGDWAGAVFGVALTAVVMGAGLAVDRGFAAFGRFPAIHLSWAIGPLAAFGVFWVWILNVAGRGDAPPLPYLPVVNPLDVTAAALLLAAVDAWLRARRTPPPLLPRDWEAPAGIVLVASLFFWLNGGLARSVHQWAEVPFRADALWDATPMQAAMSISWTLVALGGMLWCTRRGWRSRWIAASALLGVTVVKLFLVDLGALSTGARIGTFLVVGVLLLVVGYLSPVPPADQGDAAGAGGTA
jgi:uncharacterized membrane protein